jgi:tetratricopeptide (TPR) repeat protein
LKAAKNLPAAQSIRLLRAALEDVPAGDTARVPLLKAASQAGDYHLAIAAMQPYLSGANLENTMDGTEQNAEPDEDAAIPGSQAGDNGRIFAKLPVKDRAEICRYLGMAFEKTKSLNQALAYLQRAYRLEPDAGLKAQINRQAQQIRSVLRRQAANHARQPEIHSELEQQHIVHQRLPERTLSIRPTPQGQVQKGAGQ